LFLSSLLKRFLHNGFYLALRGGSRNRNKGTQNFQALGLGAPSGSRSKLLWRPRGQTPEAPEFYMPKTSHNHHISIFDKGNPIYEFFD
jgi:hypothetical protein